jgi:hypothetical protein
VRGAAILILCAGCAGPFTEVHPSTPSSGVAITYCGSSATSTESVLQAMEPPAGRPDMQLRPPKELHVCLRLSNAGKQPARLNRSYVQLRCPREKQEWVPDSDDDVVIVHPGEARELHVGFHYSPLDAGEEVAVTFDGAVSAGGRPLKLAPIVLRKQ